MRSRLGDSGMLIPRTISPQHHRAPSAKRTSDFSVVHRVGRLTSVGVFSRDKSGSLSPAHGFAESSGPDHGGMLDLCHVDDPAS